LRLPSAVAAVATIPVVYRLGRQLFSPAAGWIAALLIAVQPFHVQYSQEARSYALCLLLASAAFLFFAKAVDGNGFHDWLFYAVFSALAIFTHLYAIMLLPSQWLAFLLWRKRAESRARFLGSTLAILIFVAPMFWLALVQNVGQNDWTPPVHAKDVLHALQSLMGTGPRFVAALFLLLMAATALKKNGGSADGGETQWRQLLVWCWFVVPAAGVVSVSLMEPPFVPRYLLMVLPACVLLIAHGIAQLKPRGIAPAVVALMAVLYLSSLVSYYRKPNEDWREAAAYIVHGMKSGDRILFDREYGEIPFQYYAGRMRAVSPAVLGRGKRQLSEPGTSRLWVVLYGPQHANAEQVQRLVPSQLRLADHEQFASIEVLLFSP